MPKVLRLTCVRILRRKFNERMMNMRLRYRRPSNVVLYLGLAISLILLVKVYFRNVQKISTDDELAKQLHMDWATNGLFRLIRNGATIFQLSMGAYMRIGTHVSCKLDFNPKAICRDWPTVGRIYVHQYEDNDATCFDIVDENRRDNEPRFPQPAHCFDVANSHWYGGAETYKDQWPLQMTSGEKPHASDTGSYGSVHDRYWFSTSGIGVFIDDSVPLHISGDGSSFCLRAHYDMKTYYLPESPTVLNYTVCIKENVKAIHLYMSNRFIKKPIGIPDETMIKKPVWSTWAKYKSGIDQQKTLGFVKEIVKNGFPVSQIELDDTYTINYGDYEFDPAKFPDARAMINELHRYGFRLTVWTHPFANKGSGAYTEGYHLGYFVKDESGATGQGKWWRGADAGVLDVTNPAAVQWFKDRLIVIRKMGVDGHKFDAGEIGFLPAKFVTYKQVKNPMHFSKIYAETMYNITNNFMQMRVGYKTQHLPIFISMMDRSSTWGLTMGLKSLIPTSLIFSSLGYIFIMPDMIGGNAYCEGDMDCTHVKPERELYIRWLQLTAFLPMMQFSFTPWQYDEEVISIARYYVTLHSEYVAPLIIELGKEAMVTGYPIIRPMWWLAPVDPVSWTVDSQFMVGDTLLVAPVLSKSEAARDIYLPMGRWLDKLTSEVLVVDEPGYILKQHPVVIQHIPYFERQESLGNFY